MSPQLTIEQAVQARNDILHCIAIDPQMSPTVRAVATAIDTLFNPGDVVSANDIRPHLPVWVKRQGLGAAFGHLVREGALRRLDWVISTDPGTHGKPVGRYLVLHPAAEAAA